MNNTDMYNTFVENYLEATGCETRLCWIQNPCPLFERRNLLGNAQWFCIHELPEHLKPVAALLALAKGEK